MNGKLIIIEGGDGSGKATQTAMLVERLAAEGRPVRSVSFPDYDSDSSALVKMYLRGDFGGDADGVNPYAASAFYAVDRFASYQTQWKSFLQDGGIVVADRYTTSNMLYQMIKIDDAAAQEATAHGRTDGKDRRPHRRHSREKRRLSAEVPRRLRHAGEAVRLAAHCLRRRPCDAHA